MERTHQPFWIGGPHSDKSRGALTNTTCYHEDEWQHKHGQYNCSINEYS